MHRAGKHCFKLFVIMHKKCILHVSQIHSSFDLGGCVISASLAQVSESKFACSGMCVAERCLVQHKAQEAHADTVALCEKEKQTRLTPLSASKAALVPAPLPADTENCR